MKGLQYLICLFLAIVTYLPTNAQNSTFLTDTTISMSLRAYYEPDKKAVYVRWATNNYHTWELGIKHGFVLHRMIKEKGGEVLPTEEMLSTDKAWKFNVASQEEFQASPIESVRLAGDAVYSPDDFVMEAFSDNPLVKAKNKEDEKVTRVMTNLLATDQNQEAAQMMGMFFLNEEEVEPEHKYFYFVNINLDPKELKGSKTGFFDLSTSEKDIVKMPDITDLSTEGADLAVTLRWKMETNNWYNYYDIYRSKEIGGGYEKRNKEPFIFTGAEGATHVSYVDEVSTNNTTYFYKVIGHTPFFSFGPESKIVRGAGKPKPIPATPYIQQIGEVNKKMNIRWEFSDKYLSAIQGYKISRSNKKDGTYKYISSIIPANKFEYLDPSPLPTNYYSVIAIDNNGYELASAPSIGILNDEEPPAPPSGGKGTMDKEGNINLTWTPNKEPDFSAYQVFVANHADGEYVPATKDQIKENTFYYYYTMQTLTRQIFFKLAAYDLRENRSNLSAPIEIAIPDVIPPSAPILVSAIPVAMGIQLEWVKSPSKDIKHHELERRAVKSSNWELLQTIDTQNPIPSNFYLDNKGELLQEYDYRIVAYDQSGLSTPSVMQRVKNYAGGFRPDIINPYGFEDQSLKYYYQNNASKIASNTNAATIESYIKLYWEYPFSKDIHDFQIYRSMNNSSSILIKSVSYNDALFQGTFTVPNTNAQNGAVTLGNPKNSTNPALNPNNPNTANTQPNTGTTKNIQSGLIYQYTKGGFHYYLNQQGQTVQVPVTTASIRLVVADVLIYTSTQGTYNEYTDKTNGATVLIPITAKLTTTDLIYQASKGDYDYYNDAKTGFQVSIPTLITPNLQTKTYGAVTAYYDPKTDITVNTVNGKKGFTNNPNAATPTVPTGSFVGKSLAFSQKNNGYYEYIDKSTSVIVGIPGSINLSATSLDYQSSQNTYDTYSDTKNNTTIDIPTGATKTLVAAGNIKGYDRYDDSATRIYILVPNNGTIGQTGTNPNSPTGTGATSPPPNLTNLQAFMTTDDDLNTILSVPSTADFTYQVLVRFKDGTTSKLSVPFKLN